MGMNGEEEEKTALREQSFFSAPQYDATRARQYANEYYDRNRPAQTYEEMFGRYIPAPKQQYDQKQEKRMMSAAVAAEGLKSLAEIFAQGKGAHVQRREPVEIEKTQKRIDYYRNKYDSDLREYNRFRLSAGEKDEESERRLRANAEGYGQNLAQMLYGQDLKQFEYERGRRDSDENRKKDFDDKIKLMNIAHEHDMVKQKNAQGHAEWMQKTKQEGKGYRISIKLNPTDQTSPDIVQGNERFTVTDISDSQIDNIIANIDKESPYINDVAEFNYVSGKYLSKKLSREDKRKTAAKILQADYDSRFGQTPANSRFGRANNTNGASGSRFNK